MSNEMKKKAIWAGAAVVIGLLVMWIGLVKTVVLAALAGLGWWLCDNEEAQAWLKNFGVKAWAWLKDFGANAWVWLKDVGSKVPGWLAKAWAWLKNFVENAAKWVKSRISKDK